MHAVELEAGAPWRERPHASQPTRKSVTVRGAGRNVTTSNHLIERALPGLDLILKDCQRAITDWERCSFYGQSSDEEQEQAAEQLEYYLRKFRHQIALVLEAVGMPSTRTLLLRELRKLEGEGAGFRAVEFYPEHDAIVSRPLTLLRDTVEGLQLLSGKQESPVDTFLRERFVEILRDTGHLVHKRRVDPKNEHDVQLVMRDYLEVVFPDFVKEFDIPGVLKNFKPDGGVRSLKAAVEFKFADSEAEVVRALSGLFEDSAGYAGSDDWTTFYSVVYMTGPHATESRFKSDIRRGGLRAWTPILVQGPGGRRARGVPSKGRASPRGPKRKVVAE